MAKRKQTDPFDGQPEFHIEGDVERVCMSESKKGRKRKNPYWKDPNSNWRLGEICRALVFFAGGNDGWFTVSSAGAADGDFAIQFRYSNDGAQHYRWQLNCKGERLEFPNVERATLTLYDWLHDLAGTPDHQPRREWRDGGLMPEMCERHGYMHVRPLFTDSGECMDFQSRGYERGGRVSGVDGEQAFRTIVSAQMHGNGYYAGVWRFKTEDREWLQSMLDMYLWSGRQYTAASGLTELTEPRLRGEDD